MRRYIENVQVVVDQAHQLAVGFETLHRAAVKTVLETYPRGYVAKTFRQLDTLEVPQRVQRAARGRFGIDDDNVAALADLILHVDHVIDGVFLETADDHDAAGHRDTEHG